MTAFTAGQKATVRNAGLIDLSTGNDAQGRLTLNGDYLGDNATLRLNSVLAGDEAVSDRLVVGLGSITGSTRLQANNLGGAGAATAGNGIQVVEAREGVPSSDTAFVQTQTRSAGAYDHRLFKQPGQPPAGSQRHEPGGTLATLAAGRQQPQPGDAQ
ncbi:autotransporter outer membrane beta-barrel domain-containing protein [Pseudomonas entomophila]|uniref:autotransporter outer membrane beta-barrel domain-containing protein n=1 Tax=Pseudomonas entomophila TaxID=312306 RepID=UPI003D80A738